MIFEGVEVVGCRDTSGCKTGFAFIEYAANIDLPFEVVEHPIIKAMSDATNDLVSWANVSQCLSCSGLRINNTA